MTLSSFCRLLFVIILFGCSSNNSHPEKVIILQKELLSSKTETHPITDHIDNAPVAETAHPADDVGIVADKNEVQVICRESWGAKKPTRNYVRHEVNKLTIHHQGVVFEDNTRALRRIRSMQRYHQSSQKNFIDIAYHFIIDLEGNIYEGRPSWAVGETRTDYDPAGHLLVCLLGNFEVQDPTTKQIDTLVSLLAWASSEFNVPATTIKGHRDHAHTLCPGKNLYSLIASTIRPRVSSLSQTESQLLLNCNDAGKSRKARK